MRPRIFSSKGSASYPAALHLIFYGLAIALPLLLVLGVLFFRSASFERERVNQQILQVLGAMTNNLDRDLDRHLTILRTLATSSALESQDWRAFYDQAKAGLQGRAYIVLVDDSGRQLVNTYVPYGEAPAMTGDPETVRLMAESNRPVVSNLFTSLVVKKPVFNVSIPILRDGRLRFVMSLGLLPEDLTSLLAGQNLGPQWVTMIFDAHDVILARSSGNAVYGGATLPAHLRTQGGAPAVVRTTNLDGEDVLHAAGRSRISGWGATVNVPVNFVQQQLQISLWLLAATAVLAVILAVGLGFLAARQLTRPLAAASAAAIALGREQPIEVSNSFLKEANTFNDTLRSAQRELAQRASDLRESELRLAAILEQMPLGVGLMDRDGRWILTNLVMRRFIPEILPSRDPKRMRQWQSFAADGRPLEAAQWPIVRALHGETVSPGIAFIYTADDGHKIWMRVTAAPFRNSDEEIVGAVAVLEDITDQKRASEAEKILIRELQHRTNNLLAVIQAIAHRSLSGPGLLDEARTAFEARLQALARAHRQLVKSNWSGVSLGEIVRSALEPFSARTDIDGANVMLGAKDAQNFSLAVHELATNAVKYGALCSADGKVSIVWAVTGNGSDPVLKFRWEERGGPPVIAPERHGFGTSLLRATFSKVDFDYAPEGLTCEIHVTLGKLELGTFSAAENSGSSDQQRTAVLSAS